MLTRCSAVGWALHLLSLSSAAIGPAQCPRVMPRGKVAPGTGELPARREGIFPTLRVPRNYRQQQIRFGLPAGIDRIRSAVVVGMVVHVTGAADAVARLDIEADTVAAAEHHRGRPDLDLDPHDLAGLEIKSPLVSMMRPVWQRQLWIQFPM